MNEITRTRRRISDAALATGLTTKTVRNWLHRGLFEESDDSPDGWRIFSDFDVAKLALMKPMIDFGVPVATAADIASSALRKSQTLSKLTKLPTTLQSKTFLALLSAVHVFIHQPEDGSWKWTLGDEPGDMASRAFLTIRAGAIVREAFDALSEGGE